jgi:hypothetical protein
VRKPFVGSTLNKVAKAIGSGAGNSKQLIAMSSSIPTNMAGPGALERQAGLFLQRSALSPSSNSLRAVGIKTSENRIRFGVAMLLDRACMGGGWNSGNSMAYGTPLRPQVDTTAIALLALQDEERSSVIRSGLEWLKERAPSIQSVESLAWCILSLFVYQEPVERLKKALAVKAG